jgi:hypothetical protein
MSRLRGHTHRHETPAKKKPSVVRVGFCSFATVPTVTCWTAGCSSTCCARTRLGSSNPVASRANGHEGPTIGLCFDGRSRENHVLQLRLTATVVLLLWSRAGPLGAQKRASGLTVTDVLVWLSMPNCQEDPLTRDGCGQKCRGHLGRSICFHGGWGAHMGARCGVCCSAVAATRCRVPRLLFPGYRACWRGRIFCILALKLK